MNHKLLLIALGVSCAVFAQAQFRYSIRDLGALNSGGTSYALGVNDAGIVVGASDGRPVRWTSEGIEILGGSSTVGEAYGINAQGDIAGWSGSTNGTEAFLWNATSGLQGLGRLPGGSYSTAYGISPNGDVVGDSTSESGDFAFRWRSGSGMQNLGAFASTGTSIAYGINGVGQVVGESASSNGWRAFVWTDAAGMVSLGTLSGATDSHGAGINASGTVTGDSGGRGFVWTSSFGMHEIDNPFGFTMPYAISDTGIVVGRGLTSADRQTAFIWTGSGSIQDLNSLVEPSTAEFTLTEARGMNSSNQIVGEMVLSDGSHHAFLATPVPEPNCLIILVSAMLWRFRERGR